MMTRPFLVKIFKALYNKLSFVLTQNIIIHIHERFMSGACA